MKDRLSQIFIICVPLDSRAAGSVVSITGANLAGSVVIELLVVLFKTNQRAQLPESGEYT
jgi:hypothetical protein